MASPTCCRQRRRRRCSGASVMATAAALALCAGKRGPASTAVAAAYSHTTVAASSPARAATAAASPVSLSSSSSSSCGVGGGHGAGMYAKDPASALGRTALRTIESGQIRRCLRRPSASSTASAAAPLCMATDSRELRFFAGMPPFAGGTRRDDNDHDDDEGTGGPEYTAPRVFDLGRILLSGIGGAGSNNNREAEFTSALATTAVFSSSAYRREHAGEFSRVPATQRVTTSLSSPSSSSSLSWRQQEGNVNNGGSTWRIVSDGIASSLTACLEAATQTATATLSLYPQSTATLPSYPANRVSHSSGERLDQRRGRTGNGVGGPRGGGGDPPASIVAGPTIDLSDEERELFKLLAQVVRETHLTSTLRVAGGWVRDKLLATEEFRRRRAFQLGGQEDEDDGEKRRVERLTSKFKSRSEASKAVVSLAGRQPSAGRQGTKLVGKPSSPLVHDNDGDVLTVALLDNGATASLSDDESSGDGDGKDSFSNSQPVDIDVALDDMLGREFADHLNDWLSEHGRETAAVGVVLKNPEKSKHLETATMKVGDFWIDFVNLRAEEYTSDSRIPDLMRIGTAKEDAHRRDLTINALFYNINTGRVEDWTGRGFDDLRRGIVATPLPPLTTLLDDPLRVLRAVRFAARLRFRMDDSLREAARDVRVREALGLKVARERVGSEVDLMLRSPDPVGAMRLLVNLRLVDTVFPADGALPDDASRAATFARGLALLSATHDYLLDCKARPPLWCERKRAAATRSYGASETTLIDDEESRRLLWYASFLKPFRDATDKARAHANADANVDGGEKGAGGARNHGKRAKRSSVTKLLVDELKRPVRDADAIEKIMKAADDFTALLDAGCDGISRAVLEGDVSVRFDADEECGVEYYIDPNGNCYSVTCKMRRRSRDGVGGLLSSSSLNRERSERLADIMSEGDSTEIVDSVTESDPLWKRAMAFRLLASKVLNRVGPLWRAAMVLSLSERLAKLNNDEFNYAIEGDYMDQDFEEIRRGVVQRYDTFAAALQQLGLIGIWSQKPLIDGVEMKKEVLRKIPKGPVFRDIMDEQERWMTTHPGGSKEALVEHMRAEFPEFVG